MARVDRAVHGVSLKAMPRVGYPGVMSYVDGGGLSERGRASASVKIMELLNGLSIVRLAEHVQVQLILPTYRRASR